MNKNTKNIVAAAVLILAVGGIYLGAKYGIFSKAPAPQTPESQEQTQTATSTEQTATTTTKKQTKTQKPIQIQEVSYAEAVNLFAGRRVQITTNCQLLPAYMVLKNGMNVMIDNRTNETVNIWVDGKEYLLNAFNYKIIYLQKQPLPYTVRIDCGSGKNNGQIILQ